MNEFVPFDDATKEKPNIDSRYGGTPIVAYTPTYGFIAGVAGFVFPKFGHYGLNSHLVAAATPDNGNVNIAFGLQDNWNKHWGFKVEAVFTNFFTSYYGEGDATPPESLDYYQRFYRAHEGVVYQLDDADAFEVFVETRSRTDLGLTTDTTRHLAPDESRSVLGLLITRDTRDSVINTREGYFGSVQVQSSVSRGYTQAFAQLELEYRYFIPLEQRLVLGLRSEISMSSGKPSYNYEYNFGGLERMRGFLHNRFRGNQYYMGGFELRQDVWGDHLQIVVFADGGDIKDQAYVRPRFAYGAGLRIGLPPDWDMKFRIDCAQSDDQSGVFATFGQAF